jgi:cell wall-associated NlpC family hydrolase
MAEKTAQKLTVVDEQVHQAELTVAKQKREAKAAAKAAAAAEAAVAAFEPQLRAIAHSGYTGRSQSRVAAFLTSTSATELVQTMTTLDMIADHTDAVVSRAAAAQDAALKAQAAATLTAKKAGAGLAELKKQKADLRAQADKYQAAFARLTAREQARLSRRIAGPRLAAPSVNELPVVPGSKAATAIEVALSKVGAPYEMGASGPGVFDCSGLTQFAYAAAGISLPHSSAAQSAYGRPVSRGELQPGDLVFYSVTPNASISHVAIYLGKGLIVHARTWGTPLGVTGVDSGGVFAGAVRLDG